MPGIRIKSSTLKALNMVKGLVMSQEGVELSHDEVINFLLMTCRISKDMFPEWPVFRGRRNELEKAIRDFHSMVEKASEELAKERKR